MTDTHFEAVLLKPLDQQRDRDGNFIDPAGVTFDPEVTYPIFREFSYSVPDDVVGSGKVERAPDGSLIVKGVLIIDVNAAMQEGRFPYSLAIGVRYNTERNGTPYVASSDLMSIGFTAEHVDPDQPRINIIRRDRTVNLVRLGHYHTPNTADDAGSCQTALVVKVGPEADGVAYVNLVVWDSDGDQQRRLDVPVVPGTLPSEASFHLSGDCPHGR